jgi:hypothetical protein
MRCPLCGDEHEKLGEANGVPVYACPDAPPNLALFFDPSLVVTLPVEVDW